MTPNDLPLPPLREDLQILRGGTSYSGAPVWVVLDPIRNRFFRVTYEMFQLLSLWNRSQSFNQLNHALQRRFGRETDPEEISTVMRMLDANFFLAQPLSGTWRGLYEGATRRHSLFMQLIHNYLFFRIPLVRPQRFIQASWPYVSFLFTRGFLFLAGLVGLCGLYLVSRQWDAFVSTFPYVFSLEGAALSLVSVALIKSMHELGHAYVAHMFRCRIPTMGMAFMVMIPLLYTDVSDSWRLKSKRSRIMIDCAGVITELCVAAFALFLWAFIPDGPLRSAIFVLAAVGWILSLLVNTNPFMRFDGYYILADFLGVENLQPRAFRHMRWRLRELLFGVGYQPPESFPPRLDATLTLYAICTTIYRLLLYVGIALLVYHFTIKLVGIVLFAVEVGFFMIRPVWSEIKEWWSMRQDILRSRRTYITLGLVIVAAILVAMPLSTRVRAPAIMLPETFVRLYSEEPGRVELMNVKRGQTVKQGDVLFVIASPALVQERELADIEMSLAQRRLARIGANSDDLVQKNVVENQLNRLLAQRAGLMEREEKLVIRAPFDGHIADLNSEIAPGQWVSRKEQFAYLEGTSGVVVRGYIGGEDRARVEKDATGMFIPDDVTQRKLEISVQGFSVSSARQIELPQLTSQFGGKIAVHPSTNGRFVPVSAQYAVTADITGAMPNLDQTQSGVLLINGRAESLLARAWRRVLTVLVRESGA